MPGFIGATELIMLAVVALLVFGPRRLPEMGRSLGKGLREFRDSVSSSDDAKQPARVVEAYVRADRDHEETPFEEADRLTAERDARTSTAS